MRAHLHAITMHLTVSQDAACVYLQVLFSLMIDDQAGSAEHTGNLAAACLMQQRLHVLTLPDQRCGWTPLGHAVTHHTSFAVSVILMYRSVYVPGLQLPLYMAGAKPLHSSVHVHSPVRTVGACVLLHLCARGRLRGCTT